MKKDILLIGAGAFVVGGAVCGTATYFIFRRRVIKNAEERANKEIASVKDTYRLLRKEPPYDDLRTAVPAYLDRLDELKYAADEGIEAAEEIAQTAVVDAEKDLDEALRELDEVEQAAEAVADIPEVRDEETLTNIFDRARRAYKGENGESSAPPVPEVDAFDLLAARDPSEPYVIPTDAFMDDENGFEKITITYYEGDDTLADDGETPIPDVEGTVGKVNLNKFGEDSDSRDTVYIRNERLQTDFEVVREEGDFTEIVLGYKVSDKDRRVSRMRDDE